MQKYVPAVRISLGRSMDSGIRTQCFSKHRTPVQSARK